MLYCGWDGGGTKTEVCLLDETGRIASAVFGPLNPNGAARDRVPETVKACVNYMKEQAGSLSEIAGLVVGMAGISNLSARSLLENALADVGWTGPLRLLGDQEIALAGAVEGPGMLLIAGTGSVCCGRDAAGNLFRVGGYGYLIDDCGSGWAIGRDILSAVVRAEDGRAAKLANPQPRWSVNFPMSDAAFAPGRRYAVQMRLRADLTPGRKGPAVTAGIYDPKTKKYACTCAYPAEKLSGDYAWYTIGTFDPSTLSESAYLYVGDGYLDKKGRRFVPALYLDKIRFVEKRRSRRRMTTSSSMTACPW